MYRFKLLYSLSFLLLAVSSCTDPNPLDTPATVAENQLLQLVNKARMAGCNCGSTYYPPVAAVTWNDLLEATAQQHSEDMREQDKLSHRGSNGSDPGDRVTESGYRWRTYGENIAEGYTSEESVIKGWLESQGHCKNIMNEGFTEMGVATSGKYWTQVFGAPR